MVNSLKPSIGILCALVALALPANALAVGEVTKTFTNTTESSTPDQFGVVRSNVEVPAVPTNPYDPHEPGILDIKVAVYYSGTGAAYSHLKYYGSEEPYKVQGNSPVDSGTPARGTDCAGGMASYYDAAPVRSEDSTDLNGEFKPWSAGQPMLDVSGDPTGSVWGFSNFNDYTIDGRWALQFQAGQDFVLHCWSLTLTYQGDGYTDCNNSSDDLDVLAVPCATGQKLMKKGTAYAKRVGYKCKTSAYQSHRLVKCSRAARRVRFLR